jgi:hypothetical protein
MGGVLAPEWLVSLGCTNVTVPESIDGFGRDLGAGDGGDGDNTDQSLGF